MIYQIHGQPLTHDDSECGIYRAVDPVQRMRYAVMDMNHLIRTVNSLPKEQAVATVTKLRDLAAEQAQWQYTPQNLGSPFLRQIPEAEFVIDEVRGNLQNTERFCNDVLRLLRGE